MHAGETIHILGGPSGLSLPPGLWSKESVRGAAELRRMHVLGADVLE